MLWKLLLSTRTTSLNDYESVRVGSCIETGTTQQINNVRFKLRFVIGPITIDFPGTGTNVRPFSFRQELIGSFLAENNGSTNQE
jgi:hypothetical protein